MGNQHSMTQSLETISEWNVWLKIPLDLLPVPRSMYMPVATRIFTYFYERLHFDLCAGTRGRSKYRHIQLFQRMLISWDLMLISWDLMLISWDLMLISQDLIMVHCSNHRSVSEKGARIFMEIPPSNGLVLWIFSEIPAITLWKLPF